MHGRACAHWRLYLDTPYPGDIRCLFENGVNTEFWHESINEGRQFHKSLTSQNQPPVSSSHTESELPIVQKEPCAAELTCVSNPRSFAEHSVKAFPLTTQGWLQGSSSLSLKHIGVPHGHNFDLTETKIFSHANSWRARLFKEACLSNKIQSKNAWPCNRLTHLCCSRIKQNIFETFAINQKLNLIYTTESLCSFSLVNFIRPIII